MSFWLTLFRIQQLNKYKASASSSIFISLAHGLCRMSNDSRPILHSPINTSVPNVWKMLIYRFCILFSYSMYINDNTGQCKTESRDSRILNGAEREIIPTSLSLWRAWIKIFSTLISSEYNISTERKRSLNKSKQQYHILPAKMPILDRESSWSHYWPSNSIKFCFKIGWKELMMTKISEPKSLKEDTIEITNACVHGSTLVLYKAM